MEKALLNSLGLTVPWYPRCFAGILLCLGFQCRQHLAHCSRNMATHRTHRFILIAFQ